MSMPRRRAIEERTWSRSSISPSISLDLRTSSVRVSSIGFGAELEAERLHAADQPPLPVADGGQRSASASGSSELRPILAVHGCRLSFSAPYAEIIAVIRRKGNDNLRTLRGEYSW